MPLSLLAHLAKVANFPSLATLSEGGHLAGGGRVIMEL
jgi:hypothetical protein